MPQQQSRQSPEDSLFHVLGDVMTGGKWGMTYGVLYVLRNVNAWLILPFLRFNIGRKLFTFGIWFWGVSYCFCYWMLNNEGWGVVDENTRFYSSYVFIHGQLFSLAYIVQAIWSWLRFQFKYYSLPVDIGYSTLYFLFLGWWLRPLGLTKGWFRITELRWVQYIEPLLLFWGAWYLALGTYTTFLYIAISCYTWQTWQAINRMQELGAAKEEAAAYRALTKPAPPQKKEEYIIGG